MKSKLKGSSDLLWYITDVPCSVGFTHLRVGDNGSISFVGTKYAFQMQRMLLQILKYFAYLHH